MKPFRYLGAGITFFLLTTFGNAQELPNYKEQLLNGANYQTVTSQVETAINNSSTLTIDEGGELNKYARWRAFWDPRLGGSNGQSVDLQDYKQAIFNHYYLNNCTGSSNTPEWNFRGPTGVFFGAPSTRMMAMGRIDAVAMHKSKPSVMYAGACSSGLWKTTNAQDPIPTWTNITDGYGFDNIGITDIQIDPKNANIIYVSTGPIANGTGYGIGVIKSTNGGTSWEQTTLGYLNQTKDDSDYVRQLRINPSNSSLIYAMTNGEIKRSSDAGATWPKTNLNPSGTLESLELDRSGQDIVYAAGKEVWIRENSTWSRIDGGMHHLVPVPAGGTLKGRDFRVSADNLGVYVLAHVEYLDATNDKQHRYDLLRYKKTNGNWAWTYLQSQPYFAQRIVVSPTDANIIYYQDDSSFRGVGKSIDGGMTIFRQTGEEPDQWVNGASTHVDIRDLELVTSSANGTADWVVVGNDGGVLYSDQTFLGQNNKMLWKNMNGDGLTITEFWGIGSVKYKKEYVALGAQDNAAFSLMDGIWRVRFGGDGYDAIIATNDDIILQRNFPSQFLSTNYGVSYSQYFPDYGGMQATHDPMEHSNGGQISSQYNEWWKFTKWPSQQMANGDIYVGRYDLAKKDNAANTFHWISNFNTLSVPGDQVLIDIAVNENNDDQIFAVFDKHIFRTLDGGVNWTDISVGLQQKGFRTIVIDPNDAKNVWIGLKWLAANYIDKTGPYLNRVLHSTNALSSNPTWDDYSVGLPAFPVEEIVYEEGSNKRLYAATDVGVYYRECGDPNSQWECFTNGMPGVAISDLAINYCNRTIYAATHGRGMWSTDLLPPDYAVVDDVSSQFIDTWSTDRVLKGSVKVPAGHKLTINNATITMMADAKIIVEPGAELIVNNSTITSECGGFWSGIEVWSDANANTQLGSFPNRQVGKLVIENSTISNAHDAISMYKQKPNLKGGGFVEVKNTHFLNNRRAVEFAYFENYSPIGIRMDNFSSFKNCVFEIDKDYRFDIKDPHHAMVTAFGTRGVKFLGCDFLNNSDQALEIAGLYMYDSKFTIGGYGTQDPCTFENLKSGVTALKAAHDYNFIVKGSQFTNCKTGVASNGIQNASITHNTFNVDEHYLYDVPVGVFLENSNGFVVEENTFTLLPPGNPIPGQVYFTDGFERGIYVENSGVGSNQIYKNHFNKMNFSNTAVGVNYNIQLPEFGLTYRCNKMSESKANDILVHKDTKHILSYLGYSGIAGKQGAVDDPVDNTFTQGINNSEGHIANEAANRVDYYHRANAGGFIYEPTNMSSSVATYLQSGGPNLENSCPSHNVIGNPSTGWSTAGMVGQWKTDFTAGKTAFDLAKYVYVSTIDGGDTYALLNTVQNNNTQTAWELRTELIESSPLSLDVIFGVIEEAFLSNALLHDVLMVNPHGVRDEGVMELLESKPTPMPAYMINTLLGIYEVQTQKDVLEAEMANEMQKMNTAANMLYTHWSADSLDPDNDSILFISQSLNTESGDWKAVEFQLSRGNVSEASGLIAAMPAKYDLIDWNLYNFDTKKAFFEYVINTGQTNVMDLYEPSATQLQTLQQMADGSGTYAARLAQNQVMWGQNQIYWPEIASMSAGKKAKKDPRQLRDVSELPLLAVYPNPANNYVTLRAIHVSAEIEVQFQIINSSGVVVRSQTQQLGPNEEVNVKTQDLASGHYFVLFYQNNQLLQKLPFEVVH